MGERAARAGSSGGGNESQTTISPVKRERTAMSNKTDNEHEASTSELAAPSGSAKDALIQEIREVVRQAWEDGFNAEHYGDYQFDDGPIDAEEAIERYWPNAEVSHGDSEKRS